MKNKKSILFIFSGLPGSGKTTLSKLLAQQTKSFFLRIDTIEQALRDTCSFDVQDEGYLLAYKLAFDNLSLGIGVVADSCNPVQLSRDAWEKVAMESNSNFINIETICSDKKEHQKRIETRRASIFGLVLPTWEEVKLRDYHHWITDRIIIDTAFKTQTESFRELMSRIKTHQVAHK